MKGRGKKTSEEAKFNQKVMRNLEESGAVNYLSAGMFSRLAQCANSPQHKDFIISSDIQPPKSVSELIAARLVFEYLVDHRLVLSRDSLTSEIDSDAYSSKTTASLAPLQLPNNSDVIYQLLEIHKELAPPPSTKSRSIRQDDLETPSGNKKGSVRSASHTKKSGKGTSSRKRHNARKSSND
ncbi:hypothetical protein TRFO_04941 [Tritrichomonas foetus]|uniref:Uncharacterized protein n=1 Tax=Tritrichomonas foetus TaxID=1144522 RepID=A0A1J4KA48_9EUKA|nr:hypothetical protein TRFO_04941 [Tritrichomonas foetus]|eukprot:OHT08321.1 hypothetical protein TRFO_04941 [Tritrichomonas foetus]